MLKVVQDGVRLLKIIGITFLHVNVTCHSAIRNQVIMVCKAVTVVERNYGIQSSWRNIVKYSAAL